MDKNNMPPEMQDYVQNILDGENRYVQEVTIDSIAGTCPCGHCVGQTFRVTALNSDGLCGALYKEMHSSIVALHYAGGVIWEDDTGQFSARCPEGGCVSVRVRRSEQPKPLLLKTAPVFVKMPRGAYPLLDRYRLQVEVLDIAGSCYWGHAPGDVFEVDPFNVGDACGMLYAQLYPYMHVLLSGATPPWAVQAHSITAECPDTYNRLMFRLVRQER